MPRGIFRFSLQISCICLGPNPTFCFQTMLYSKVLLRRILPPGWAWNHTQRAPKSLPWSHTEWDSGPSIFWASFWQPVWGNQRLSNSASPICGKAGFQLSWQPDWPFLLPPKFTQVKPSEKASKRVAILTQAIFLMFSHHVSIFHLSPSAFCLDCSFLWW